MKEDSNEEIFIELVHNLLPSVKELRGALFQRFRDREDRHDLRNGDELDLPPKDDAEARSPAASDGPKQVFSHGFPVEDFSVSVDDPGVDDVVDREAVFPHHGAVRSSGDVPADAESGAEPGWEAMDFALLRDSVVHLAVGRADLNPRRAVLYVDIDKPEVREVYYREGRFDLGDVREAFVVVASAAEPEVYAEVFGANDGGLDVGIVQRSEDELGFRHRRRQVAEILRGGLKDGSE